MTPLIRLSVAFSTAALHSSGILFSHSWCSANPSPPLATVDWRRPPFKVPIGLVTGTCRQVRACDQDQKWYETDATINHTYLLKTQPSDDRASMIIIA